MVPSGEATEQSIKELAGLLQPGDLVVDGGNSNFRDSMRRGGELAERGLLFVDAGVSGGIWGLEIGYCLMVGGSDEAFRRIEPALKTLAPDGRLRARRARRRRAFRQDGAQRHRVRDARGLRGGLRRPGGVAVRLRPARARARCGIRAASCGPGCWSWRSAPSPPTRSSRDIRGYVDDSGEGRWTVQEAINESVPAPAITLSLFRRFASRQDDSFAMKVIAALRNEFGGHPVKAGVADRRRA